MLQMLVLKAFPLYLSKWCARNKWEKKSAISLKILGLKEPRPFFTAGTELSTRDWVKMNPKYQGQFFMFINCFRTQMSWDIAMNNC